MAENVTLYDAHGNPVRRGELTREAITPATIATRSLWAESIASGLTPVRLASLLRNAAQGDARDYLTLAEEMEERDLHYGSVLRTRKLAVTGIEVVVEAASDEKTDVDLADEIRELAREPEFDTLVSDLLDALGKGYAACEIIWERSASQWRPGRYPHRDARLFKYDRDTLSELRIDDYTPDGQALPPYKFIAHTPRLKTGIPLRGGLARMAAWMHLIKSYDVKDWVAFAEVFGMPIRVGKYGPGASEEDKAALLRAVANIGSDAAGIIPQSMMIDFIEAGSQRGQDVFEKLAKWADAQMSKGVLGQTASTEGTPGKLGNEEAQQEVRRELVRADAKQLAATLNRDLVQPFIDLNHGQRERGLYPRIVLTVPEPEDVSKLVENVARLVPLGLRVEQSVMRDKLGLPDPEDDAELLSAPATPSPFAERGPGGEVAANALARALLARNDRADFADDPTDQDLDEIEREALADWEEQMEPVLAPLRKLVAEAASLEALREGLAAIAGEMDVEELTRVLAEALFKARGAGEAQP